MKTCHELELKTDSKLRGSLIVNFTIGADGKCVNAVVEEQSGLNPDLGPVSSRASNDIGSPHPTTPPMSVRFRFSVK